MTTMTAWASSDTRPVFRIAPSNLIEEDPAAQDEWDRAIARMRCWEADPLALQDGDVEAPSRQTVQLALVLAIQGRELGMPPPTRVMPNGEAGVALEWTLGAFRNLWEITDRQRLEMRRFEGTRCTSKAFFELAGLSL